MVVEASGDEDERNAMNSYPGVRVSTAIAAVILLFGIAIGGGCTSETTITGPDEEDQQQDEYDTGGEDTGGVTDADMDAGDGEPDAPDTGEDATDENGDADEGELEPPEGMVLVERGRYKRGCHAEIDDQCSDPDRQAHRHENPAHEVTVSAFFIDRHEVTEKEHQECVADGACNMPVFNAYYDGNGPDYPVVNVTAGDAMDYCEWAGKRLPTEAEWEKAARGTDRRIYPWGNEEPDCSLANYDDCGREITPVGQHPDGASPYGVEDMAGNVRNWTADWFDPDYYDDSPQEDPQGPDVDDPDDHTRAVRGGSFHWGASFLRTSARYSMDEVGGPDPTIDPYGPDTGFRCALSVE